MVLIWIFLAMFIFSLARAALQVYREMRDAKPPLDTSQWSDEDIVEAITTLLPKGLEINKGWRDYGGDGLAHKEGRYIFAPSNDGHIDSPSEALRNPELNAERLEFASPETFAAWLLFELQQHGPCTRFHTNVSRERLRWAIEGCHGLPDEQIRTKRY